jgi:glycosyltransferase involved in cell wall biosynthesis
VGGDGELRPFYEELVRQHGLTDIVEFLGVIPQSRLPEYYNRCTVFVLPSITAAQEGFGLVALEAMACRKPVIISDIVGVAEEVRSHEAGIVVKAGDSGELTEALRFMIDHPEKRLCMAERGWRLAQEKHSWKNYALSVMSQYERYG